MTLSRQAKAICEDVYINSIAIYLILVIFPTSKVIIQHFQKKKQKHQNKKKKASPLSVLTDGVGSRGEL